MKRRHQISNQVRCAHMAYELGCFRDDKVGAIFEKRFEFTNGRTSSCILESGKPVKRLFYWIRFFQMICSTRHDKDTADKLWLFLPAAP